MNATLVAALLRQRLRSPVRMAILWTVFAFSLVPQLMAPGSVPGDLDWIWVLILGAGAVGQDVSSGVITGLLVRPVRRSEYFASRWLAVALAAAAVMLLQCLGASAISIARHQAIPVADMAWRVGLGALSCLGGAAVLTFFSACANGTADLGIYLLASLGGQVLGALGAWKGLPWLQRAAQEIEGFLRPALQAGQLHGPGFSWFAVASYLSTVSLCVALGIWLLNRREFSYATGQV